MADFEVVRTVKLDSPIHFAGDEIHELQFREAEAELLEIIERCRSDKKPKSESLEVMSWFTGIGKASLRRLKWGDTKKAMAVIADLTDAEDDDDAVPGEE